MTRQRLRSHTECEGGRGASKNFLRNSKNTSKGGESSKIGWSISEERNLSEEEEEEEEMPLVSWREEASEVQLEVVAAERSATEAALLLPSCRSRPWLLLLLNDATCGAEAGTTMVAIPNSLSSKLLPILLSPWLPLLLRFLCFRSSFRSPPPPPPVLLLHLFQLWPYLLKGIMIR
jgi:hypothetical protein